MLKIGTRGGLTCVFRNVAGQSADMKPYVDLYERQKAAATPAAAVGEGAEEKEDDERYLRGCNAHLWRRQRRMEREFAASSGEPSHSFPSPPAPPRPAPADYILYSDVNSLYAAAGW